MNGKYVSTRVSPEDKSFGDTRIKIDTGEYDSMYLTYAEATELLSELSLALRELEELDS